MSFLKRAAKLLPSDQAAQYTYAKSLMNTGNPADADLALKGAIALNERSGIADLCREARLTIARSKLKGAVLRGLRTDVVLFCLAALETFKDAGREGVKAVVFELASLAGGGLDINDRTPRFSLVSLPGKFSALQLVVYMYVGVKGTAPRTDPGVDFSKEYAFALALSAGKKNKSRPRKSGSFSQG
jgi:hypothetical protein